VVLSALEIKPREVTT